MYYIYQITDSVLTNIRLYIFIAIARCDRHRTNRANISNEYFEYIWLICSLHVHTHIDSGIPLKFIGNIPSVM